MKVKLSWFSFIPAIVLITVIKILELAGVTQLFDAISAPYMSVIVVVLSFIANLIFSLIDKETSPVYIIKRNLPVGIFALLSAACIASKSFLSIIQSFQYFTYDILALVTSGVGIVAAISFVILSLAHIQGKNYMPRIGMIFLSIPVWFCFVLIKTFLESRTVSAVDIDPVYNFALIFAMVLFLNVPMVISIIDGKNAVKGCFVYGLPMAVLGLISGINTIVNIIAGGLDYSENIVGFAFLCIGLYILLFNYELTKNMKSVNEQDVCFDADEFADFEELYGTTKEEVVVSDENYDGDYLYGYEYGTTDIEDDFVTAKDDDYINHDYDYGEIVLDDVLVKAEEDPAEIGEDKDAIFISKEAAEFFEHNILTSDEEAENVNDAEETSETPDEAETDSKNESKVENDTMNKIDRLLAEIGSIDEI